MSLVSDIKTALEAGGYVVDVSPLSNQSIATAVNTKLYRSSVTRANAHALGHTIEAEVEFAIPNAENLDVENEITSAINTLVAIDKVSLSEYLDIAVVRRPKDIAFTVTVDRVAS